MSKSGLIRTVLDGLHFSGLGSLLSPSLGGKGAILMLHHVRPERASTFDPNAHLSITGAFLDELLGELKSAGFHFVSMDELVEELGKPTSPRGTDRIIAITLDDGYKDNAQFAAPVFQAHEAPYAIFVSPGFVSGEAEIWWEDLAAIISEAKVVTLDLPNGQEQFATDTLAKKGKAFFELMDFLSGSVSEQEQRRIIRQLAKYHGYDQKGHVRREIMSWKELLDLNHDPLCSIGAHTIHHYAIARLSLDEAREEIEGSVSIIDQNLGQKTRHFAYPYGFPKAVGARDFALTHELGLASAVTTRHGVLMEEHKHHLQALPRISVNGQFQKPRYVTALLSGISTRLINKGRKINVD